MKNNKFAIFTSFIVISFLIFSFFYIKNNPKKVENKTNDTLTQVVKPYSKKTETKTKVNKKTDIYDSNTNTKTKSNKNSISWLQTNGNKITDENGKEIQLKGISSHALEWYSDIITYKNLKELKDDFNISAFRIAVYTDPNLSGYIAKKEETLNKVYSIVDKLISLDLYAIIDWHILQDNNPQMYEKEATEFFDTLSKKYSNTPNVIYEICNEPNGNVTWNENVKPYAENIIPTIRNNSPKSLILVGSPDWSKDLKSIKANPLNLKNVAYTFHFYAGTHKEEFRNEITDFLNSNLPIFISECGITDASGNGMLYEDEFSKWIDFLNERKISYIFWSFSNKNESSSILKESYNVSNNNGDLKSYLTRTGEIFKEQLNKNNDKNTKNNIEK